MSAKTITIQELQLQACEETFLQENERRSHDVALWLDTGDQRRGKFVSKKVDLDEAVKELVAYEVLASLGAAVPEKRIAFSSGTDWQLLTSFVGEDIKKYLGPADVIWNGYLTEGGFSNFAAFTARMQGMREFLVAFILTCDEAPLGPSLGNGRIVKQADGGLLFVKIDPANGLYDIEYFLKILKTGDFRDVASHHRIGFTRCMHAAIGGTSPYNAFRYVTDSEIAKQLVSMVDKPEELFVASIARALDSVVGLAADERIKYRKEWEQIYKTRMEALKIFQKEFSASAKETDQHRGQAFFDQKLLPKDCSVVAGSSDSSIGAGSSDGFTASS